MVKRARAADPGAFKAQVEAASVQWGPGKRGAFGTGENRREGEKVRKKSCSALRKDQRGLQAAADAVAGRIVGGEVRA